MYPLERIIRSPHPTFPQRGKGVPAPAYNIPGQALRGDDGIRMDLKTEIEQWSGMLVTDRVPQGRGTRAYMDVFTACLAKAYRTTN